VQYTTRGRRSGASVRRSRCPKYHTYAYCQFYLPRVVLADDLTAMLLALPASDTHSRRAARPPLTCVGVAAPVVRALTRQHKLGETLLDEAHCLCLCSFLTPSALLHSSSCSSPSWHTRQCALGRARTPRTFSRPRTSAHACPLRATRHRLFSLGTLPLATQSRR
jgi:hypothetical protein